MSTRDTSPSAPEARPCAAFQASDARKRRCDTCGFTRVAHEEANERCDANAIEAELAEGKPILDRSFTLRRRVRLPKGATVKRCKITTAGPLWATFIEERDFLGNLIVRWWEDAPPAPDARQPTCVCGHPQYLACTPAPDAHLPPGFEWSERLDGSWDLGAPSGHNAGTVRDRSWRSWSRNGEPGRWGTARDEEASKREVEGQLAANGFLAPEAPPSLADRSHPPAPPAPGPLLCAWQRDGIATLGLQGWVCQRCGRERETIAGHPAPTETCAKQPDSPPNTPPESTARTVAELESDRCAFHGVNLVAVCPTCQPLGMSLAVIRAAERKRLADALVTLAARAARLAYDETISADGAEALKVLAVDIRKLADAQREAEGDGGEGES